jgi:WhiB family transcriptional regulator, redox-sensing transcriptional regulator
VTQVLPRSSWHPERDEDYDVRDRQLDDVDGGDRWRRYAACRNEDPNLFFPLVVKKKVVDGKLVDVVTDEEPSFPPDNVKRICHRCPVAGRCLERNMDEDYGIYGSMTGYQRRLLSKKVVRKKCIGCGCPDLLLNNSQKKEVCLGCGMSWDVL